jgi:GntR family transcriptional regulator
MASTKDSTHPLFGGKGIPLYVQLAELLRRRLRKGIWAPGALLPSIPSLMQEFNVARVTVRQAIAILSTEGLLSPQRGRGTFVTEQPGFQRGLRVHTTLDELVELYRGDQPEHATLNSEIAAPNLAETDRNAAAKYFPMRRVHSRAGERYCVISIYIEHRIYDLAPRRFRDELVLPVLTSLPGVDIGAGRQVLTITGADPETASILGIPVNTPMAEVRRLLLDRSGTVIYVADITYRGDVIQLEMDLKP